MVKTTGTGYVVINIGTLLLGVPLAGLVVLGVEHPWYGMGWPGFLAVLLSWMAFGVSRLLRERGNTDIMPSHGRPLERRLPFYQKNMDIATQHNGGIMF
jgi:hypothetical protein